jgi:outer membrane protein assembly factor BamB
MAEHTEHVQAHWTYQAKEGILTIAITSDGRFIFAGGDGVLYCFEQSGNLIWRGTLEGIAVNMALAEGSSHVIVGCTSGKAYIWSYQGYLLQVLETTGPVFGISSTPTAHRIALGTLEGMLSLYDITGHKFWQHTFPRAVRQLTLAVDGNMLVLGCEDHAVYCFDAQGKQVWKFLTKDRVWAGAKLSPSSVLAGSNDGHAYCFDHNGHLRWRFSTGAALNRVVLTADGELAAGSNGEGVWVWKQSGQLLWKSTTPGAVYGLAIADDGRFVVVGTDLHAVVLFDEKGQRLWVQQMQDRVYAVSMTPNGRLIASVAADHTISLVENQLVSADEENKARERAIRQLRRQSQLNEHAGIALWFTRFDQALLERKLEVCERLLQELREGGYHLEEEEQLWLAQREGTVWLYQGMRYQQQQQVEQARQAYERSQERQHQLHDRQGEGQTLMALKMLEGHQEEHDPGWLTLLTSLPEVSGNSEMLLTQRVRNTRELVPQYQLVLTSQQLGYLHPLLAARSSPHALVQTTVAAALPWLQPGPSPEVLLDLLISPHWVVRWQAILMLIQRAQQTPRILAPYREHILQRVTEIVEHEFDPTVLRNLISLLRNIGDAAQVSGLLPLLQDPDIEVRFETVLTLAKIGTREALPGLRRVSEGKTSVERLVSDWAARARQDIRQRIPLAQVQQVICCPELTKPGPTQSTSRFLTYNPEVHCIVTLTQITAGLRVKCTFKTGRQEPMEQEVQLGIRSLQHEQQLDARQSLRDWLYRLLAEEDVAFWSWREDEEDLDNSDTREQRKEVVFSFAPARGTWFPGIYSVEIALNDVVAYKHMFKVLNREALLFAPHYYNKGRFFHHQYRYQEALLDYEQTLKFDAYDVNALCNIGDIWLVRNHLREACESYARAFQLDVNTSLNHFSTDGALHLLAVNCLEEVAATLLQTMLGSLDPTLLKITPVLLSQLSKALLAWLLEGREAATALLVTMVQGSPQVLSDHFARVVGFALLGRQEEGLTALTQMSAQSSHIIVSAVLQAWGSMLLEQSNTALSTLDTVLYEEPRLLVLYILKALIQIRLQHQAEALSILEQALCLDPNSILLLSLKCLVLHQLQGDDQILIYCQKMIDFHPDLVLPYLLKSTALLLMQDYEEALALIDGVLERAPDCIPALALAIFALVQLKRDEQAQQRCEQITTQLPAFVLARLVHHQLLQRAGRDIGDTSTPDAPAIAKAQELDVAALATRLLDFVSRWHNVSHSLRS